MYCFNRYRSYFLLFYNFKKNSIYFIIGTFSYYLISWICEELTGRLVPNRLRKSITTLNPKLLDRSKVLTEIPSEQTNVKFNRSKDFGIRSVIIGNQSVIKKPHQIFTISNYGQLFIVVLKFKNYYN